MARRDIIAGIIGAEAGAAVGLIAFGGTPLLPIAITLGGAAAGPAALRVAEPVRRQLFRRWVRDQLRTGSP